VSLLVALSSAIIWSAIKLRVPPAIILRLVGGPSIACGMTGSAIIVELGLPRYVAPMICALRITQDLPVIAGNVSDDELTVNLGLLAHHAGYLSRINCPERRCARGADIYDVSGQDV
jgi:hypothetical protein